MALNKEKKESCAICLFVVPSIESQRGGGKKDSLAQELERPGDLKGEKGGGKGRGNWRAFLPLLFYKTASWGKKEKGQWRLIA